MIGLDHIALIVSSEESLRFYEKFGFISRPNEMFGPGMHLWMEL